jgi:hypothetical protein
MQLTKYKTWNDSWTTTSKDFNFKIEGQTVIRTLTGFMIRCPACGWHEYKVGDNGWRFNGDFTYPTFTPSFVDKVKGNCHFFLERGLLIFLRDCDHEFKGKNIPLEPWPTEKVEQFKHLLKTVKRPISIQDILYSELEWNVIANFFKLGQFEDENYYIDAVKKHLLTPEQNKQLIDNQISLWNMLGRKYKDNYRKKIIDKMYDDWNAKLGHKEFPVLQNVTESDKYGNK